MACMSADGGFDFVITITIGKVLGGSTFYLEPSLGCHRAAALTLTSMRVRTVRKHAAARHVC